MAQPQLDVLSVGDVVTDAFIKLLDKEERVEHQKDGDEWLAVPFGTKIPYDHAEILEGVGNAANASVAFARLGLKSALAANVGSDQQGRDIIAALDKNKVDTRFVHINPAHKSNYHYVLWYKDERTILIKHEEYDYHWPRFRIIDIPQWVYFSSISQHAMEYHDEIASWLESHPTVKLAFQPGTFQIEAGTKRLKRIYERSEVLAVNREEATTISQGDHHDINDLFDKLHALGPKTVMISDGHAGAYASDGQNRWKMPIYPDPKPPFERTGAGDAFTSTFVAALAKGASVEEALLWAPINSMSVVQYVGAQAGLLSETEINRMLKKAPEWYHPEKLKMSRRIARLIGESEKAVGRLLAELEKHNGYPSHDARYIAQSHQVLRHKLTQLQLDPDDTTAQELFHALQTKFQEDSQNLDRHFQVGQRSLDEKVKLANSLLGQTVQLPSTWVLKTSAAKKLLKQLPPKHVMKSLNYRSIDSLLKREKMSTIFIQAQALESASWHKNMGRLVSKLDQTGFEARQLEISAAEGISSETVVVSELTGTVALAHDAPLLVLVLQSAGAIEAFGADVKSLYETNWILGWWGETDNLIADLENGQVSLNIHDVAASWMAGHGFDQRQTESSQASYWHGLMQKYENKAHLEEVFDDSVMSKVRKLNIKGPQPAFEFEYAEDL